MEKIDRRKRKREDFENPSKTPQKKTKTLISSESKILENLSEIFIKNAPDDLYSVYVESSKFVLLEVSDKFSSKKECIKILNMSLEANKSHHTMDKVAINLLFLPFFRFLIATSFKLFDEFMSKILIEEQSFIDPISKTLIEFPAKLKKTNVLYEKVNILQALEYSVEKCPATNIPLNVDPDTDPLSLIEDSPNERICIEEFKERFQNDSAILLRIADRLLLSDAAKPHLNGTHTLNLREKTYKIIEKYKDFELLKGNKFVIGVFEKMLLSSNDVNIRFNENIYYIKLLKDDNHSKKALWHLNMLKQKKLNSFEAVICLELQIELHEICGTKEEEIKAMILKLIDNYINHNKRNAAYHYFISKRKYFKNRTFENLELEAKLSDPTRASRLYYEIATEFFWNDKSQKNAQNALKYLNLSVEKNMIFTIAQSKMIEIFKECGKSKDEVCKLYLRFSKINPTMKRKFLEEAYIHDNTNEEVTENYLSLLIKRREENKYIDAVKGKDEMSQRLLLRKIYKLQDDISVFGRKNEKLENRMDELEQKMNRMDNVIQKKIIMLDLNELKRKKRIESEIFFLKNVAWYLSVEIKKSSFKEGLEKKVYFYLHCTRELVASTSVQFGGRGTSLSYNRYSGKSGWGSSLCSLSELEKSSKNYLNSEEKYLEITIVVADIKEKEEEDED